MKIEKTKPSNQRQNQSRPLLTNGNHEPTREQIALAAYTLWEQEGCPQGCDLAHWLRAEELLRHTTPQTAVRA